MAALESEQAVEFGSQCLSHHGVREAHTQMLTINRNVIASGSSVWRW